MYSFSRTREYPLLPRGVECGRVTGERIHLLLLLSNRCKGTFFFLSIVLSLFFESVRIILLLQHPLQQTRAFFGE